MRCRDVCETVYNRRSFHDSVVKRLLLAVQSEFGARAFACEHRVNFDHTYHQRYGVPGCADIRGYLIGGVPFEIEVKTGGGKMKKNQAAWAATCARLGVPHRVVTVYSTDQLQHEIDRCVAWLRALATVEVSDASP